MNFNFNNDIPIYIQLVEQLKIYIISGKLKPDEKLPSVRELALQIKVNPNTVQKALGELEDMNLIYTERTNGKYVTNNNKLIDKYKNEYIKVETEKYLKRMDDLGISKDEVLEYLKGGNK